MVFPLGSSGGLLVALLTCTLFACVCTEGLGYVLSRYSWYCTLGDGQLSWAELGQEGHPSAGH